MTGDNHVTAKAYGDVTVFTFRSERYQADAFAQIMPIVEPHVPEGERRLIVFDLSAALYINSETLRVFAKAHKSTEPAGGRVVTVGGGEIVRAVVGFLPFIDQYDRLEPAIRALSAEAAHIYAAEEGGAG